jgi:putative ABC transport system ATP-binding protein
MYLVNADSLSLFYPFPTDLLATLSAAENIALPMTIANTLSAKECKARTRELLELVGLAERQNHLPSELSGGEQQRVTIARALANKPDLLLLDEPAGELDVATTIQIMDLLLEINQKQGTTCVMVTHDDNVECYADRILYVVDGTFHKEARNLYQTRLDLALYQKHLASFKDAVDEEKEEEEEDD